MKNERVLPVVLVVVILSLVLAFASMDVEKHIGPVPVSSVIRRDHPAVRNPAAVYCTDVMGYEYEAVEVSDGGQMGICILPSGEECGQWDFYAGRCGQRYSYCAQRGYRVETRSDGRDPFAPEYAVCVSSDERVLGSITQLSSLRTNVADDADALDLDLDLNGEVSAPDRDTQSMDVPSSFDWRDHEGYNWLTGIRNQNSCGSCWAFGAVGVAEAYHNILASDPGLDLDLAEQELVSCSSAGSCSGGSGSSAMRYIRDDGIVDEGCMPYTASDSSCDKCSDWQDRRTYVDATESFLPDRQSIQQSVVDYGPVYAYMGISSDYDGYFDGSGIYRCEDDSGINHVVVIVGYDDAGGYWIVRNSWGSGFDDDGYFKVGYGECSIDSVRAGYAYNIPPTGQITSLSDGDFLNGDSVYIEAEASDNNAVDQVQFFAWYDDAWHYIDSDSDGSDGYQTTWDVSGLSDRSDIGLDALILDRVWNRWDATVGGLTLDRIPPDGQILSPSDGAVFDGCPVSIEADVSDGTSGVDFVEFYAYYNDSWHHIGDDNTYPYVFTWNCFSVLEQDIQIAIDVWDKAGNETRDAGGYVQITLNQHHVFLPCVVKGYGSPQ